MPSVSLGTNFYTISLEKFEESVSRRRIDNTIREQTMIYKTLHRKLKWSNTRVVIRICKSKKDRQYNHRTNIDLQNTTQKTKDGATPEW